LGCLVHGLEQQMKPGLPNYPKLSVVVPYEVVSEAII
jgi:hypothetical protein